MEAYTTIGGLAEAEHVEKRSRFIGQIAPVKTEEEAAALLAAVRAKHRDARHNCYAYILNSGAQRFSDDGEPQGVAGLPILEVLRREGITDVVVIVTRYFGGVLLGAPGLVRAYSHAAKLALGAADRVTMQRQIIFEVDVEYPLYDRVNSLLQSCGVLVLEREFLEGVHLKLRVPAHEFSTLALRLSENTNAAVTPQIFGEEFA